MTNIPVIVLSAVLLSAGQDHITKFQLKQASVTYRVEESTFNLTKKTIVGRNEGIAFELHAAQDGTTGKLLIDSSTFKTGVPLRDRSVRQILKSKENPYIVFEVLTIEGQDLGKVFRPLRDSLDMKTGLKDMPIDLVKGEGRDGTVTLGIGGKDVRTEGKLKDVLNKALSANSGDVHVTGRLTVGGVSKVYNAVISFLWTRNNEMSLSTAINAKFSDFNIPPPNIGVVVLSTPDRVSLVGDAVVTVTK